MILSAKETGVWGEIPIRGRSVEFYSTAEGTVK